MFMQISIIVLTKLFSYNCVTGSTGRRRMVLLVIIEPQAVPSRVETFKSAKIKFH